tara:strand:+ start:150 stop:2060 length:1911 start_codon:yes stop_codon:yes gene_type:complete
MTASKLVLNAASGVGGAGDDVDEVFSTFLYTGNSTANRTITNNIDISGEGGLVWIKGRSASGYDHVLEDTERGADKALITNSNNAANSSGFYGVNQFNSNGFRLDESGNVNNNNIDYVSWTFRKAKKFFDIVTYTGDGTSSQTISHSLDSVPGMIIVKRTDGSDSWEVYHRGISFNAGNRLRLNYTNAVAVGSGAFASAPTSTEFYVGPDSATNSSSGTYVAYLFAHNDSDGGFGPDGDQDIIKCGSYTGNGSTKDINLGFEPQWIIIKTTSTTGPWYIWDSMRGVATNGDDWYLRANESGDEGDANNIKFNSTGFSLENSTVNANGETYIYMAIRRGPLAVPDDATKVFGIDGTSADGSGPTVGFVTDFSFIKRVPIVDSWYTTARLMGQKYFLTDSTQAEATATNIAHDRMDGVWDTLNQNDYDFWAWKRAPGYFDVVTYVGNRTGGASQVIPHNLTVTPEMIWVKNRTEGQPWSVYTAANGNTKAMYIDTTNGAQTDSSWGNTSPTATNFTVGNNSKTNNTDDNFIAFLFATVAGVSKIGTYTGDGNTGKQIDCGFSSGARFILIKASSISGSWFLWDSVRGIVSGNDPYLQLNNTDAEVTGGDNVDPYSAGFIVNGPGNNASGVTYMFYAIA